MTRLPSLVAESSGIEISDKNKIWTFNDSGGEPVLYLCDTLGNLTKTLTIEGATNKDWEDITQDQDGNFYLGDFGNNDNDRSDLVIYKITNPTLQTGSSVTAEIISFTYEDQRSFPPPADSLNFDCEALMWYQENLYLCTKNRTVPFDGITNLYRLPDSSGHYIAEKIGSFNVPGNDMATNWITAGDISDDGTRLCLLSSDKMWLFYGFSEDDFFQAQSMQINLNHFSQKEGICFLTNHECYLTDEEWPGSIGRKLYSIKLDSTTTFISSGVHDGLSISPNPFLDGIWINSGSGIGQVEILSISGKEILKKSQINNINFYLGLSSLNPGAYLIKVFNNNTNRVHVQKIIKL
ncbi:MAG: T9SS type A sorting domain-containing protein [Saprospiraceae bacterium]|nr:T9SS type A sorting domain-containing protein [Saprospiraceae bacterium]